MNYSLATDKIRKCRCNKFPKPDDELFFGRTLGPGQGKNLFETTTIPNGRFLSVVLKQKQTNGNANGITLEEFFGEIRQKPNPPNIEKLPV